MSSTTSGTDSPVSLLLLAPAFGLAAGLLEGAVQVLVRLIPGGLTWQMRLSLISPELLWAGTLFYAALFLVGSLPFLALAYWLRRKKRETTLVRAGAVFAFAALAFYPVVTATGRIYWWAAILLACGLAARVVTLYHRRPDAGHTLARRAIVPLAAIPLLIAVASTASVRMHENRLYSALPPAQAGAPNVILVVLDTLRADHMSAYGYARQTTPHVDALARNGVLFENAFATAPWTVPSHATLMTGLHGYEHKADQPLPVLGTEPPCLAESLAAKGYVTGGFAANTWWVTRDVGFGRGFIRFEDYSAFGAALRTVWGQLITGTLLPGLGYHDIVDRKRASDVNKAFLTWIDAQPKRPFFAFLNYIDVHAPYLSPEPYQSRFMNDSQRSQAADFSFQPPIGARSNDAAEDALFEAGYDGALAYLDAQIGQLVTALEERGLLASTLLVLTSDHGEAFGEHGLLLHGHSLYVDQVHVPLILHLPTRLPSGLRVAAPVSLRDAPATIVSLLFPDAPSPLPGNSLARHWSQEPVPTKSDPVILAEATSRGGLPRHWPLSQGSLRSLVTAQWYLILHAGGATELYDREKDPQQLVNLADTQEGRQIVQRLQQRLESEHGTRIATSPS